MPATEFKPTICKAYAPALRRTLNQHTFTYSTLPGIQKPSKCGCLLSHVFVCLFFDVGVITLQFSSQTSKRLAFPWVL